MNKNFIDELKQVCSEVILIALKMMILVLAAAASIPPSRGGGLHFPFH